MTAHEPENPIPPEPAPGHVPDPDPIPDLDPEPEPEQPPRPSRASDWPMLPIFDQDDDDHDGPDGDEFESESDPDFDAEEDDLGEGEEVRSVLITGANGNIGRKLRAAWGDAYDLVLIDAESGDDPEVVAADLADWDASWVDLFEGVDTVIHLAANPSEHASWEALTRPNLDALCNVFHAAALAGVDRVIYASSNHAMGGYRDLGDMPITVNLPARPGNPYGAAKFFGERLAKSFAAAFQVSVIALRLGWVQPDANRAETLPDDWSRSLWLSDADMVRLFDRSVESELDPGECLVVNGMSDNDGMRWDLSEASDRLGFLPEDDAYATEE